MSSKHDNIHSVVLGSAGRFLFEGFGKLHFLCDETQCHQEEVMACSHPPCQFSLYTHYSEKYFREQNTARIGFPPEDGVLVEQKVNHRMEMKE